MIRQWSHMVGTPIRSEAEGEALGVVEGFVFHPDTGRLEALWARPLHLPLRHAIVVADDVLAWRKNLYVQGEQAFASPEDVVRIAEILARKCPFVGNRAVSEAGQDFGKVFDLDFDDRTGQIRYLFARKGFLFLRGPVRFFHAESILEVLPDRIVVKGDEGKKAKEPLLAEKPLIEGA